MKRKDTCNQYPLLRACAIVRVLDDPLTVRQSDLWYFFPLGVTYSVSFLHASHPRLQAQQLHTQIAGQ